MATKKSNPKKNAKEKGTIIKIAEKVGELAGRAMNEKDHLVEMAGEKIESAKSSLGNLVSREKKVLKKAAKKTVKKAVKKIATKKVKAGVEKAKSVVKKKVAAVKKTVKKAVKKAAKK